MSRSRSRAEAHAARPHLGIDPILVGAQMVNQLQSIVSRNVDPLESGVVSICVFQAGTTNNVIPQTAKLAGTIRSLTDEVRDLLEKRVGEVVEGVAKLHGATARRDLPSWLSGHPQSRRTRPRSRRPVASEVAGKDRASMTICRR